MTVSSPTHTARGSRKAVRINAKPALFFFPVILKERPHSVAASVFVRVFPHLLRVCLLECPVLTIVLNPTTAHYKQYPQVNTPHYTLSPP